MGFRHTVKAGECMTSIAAIYGFHDHTKLYDHPDNAALKEDRPNPNVLAPGDVVVVPDLVERQEKAPVDEAHQFKLTRPKKELRIALHDHQGEPLTDLAYTLTVEGHEPIEDQTDGDGVLRQPVPLGARRASLTIGERTLELSLGGLRPTRATPDEGLRGVQARLHNLGYNVGAEDGQLGPRTRAAIAMFQHEHELSIDGEPSDALIDALVEQHGS